MFFDIFACWYCLSAFLFYLFIFFLNFGCVFSLASTFHVLLLCALVRLVGLIWFVWMHVSLLSFYVLLQIKYYISHWLITCHCNAGAVNNRPRNRTNAIAISTVINRQKRDRENDFCRCYEVAVVFGVIGDCSMCCCS